RLRRRRQDRPRTLPGHHWGLVHPAVEHRLHDGDREELGRFRVRSGAVSIANRASKGRRKAGRRAGLSCVHASVGRIVYPVVPPARAPHTQRADMSRIQRCTFAIAAILFGLPAGTVTFAAGDFEGDHKADMTLYKSNGDWAILKSSSNYTAATTISWGGPGYVPLHGDYDDDRRHDPP